MFKNHGAIIAASINVRSAQVGDVVCFLWSILSAFSWPCCAPDGVQSSAPMTLWRRMRLHMNIQSVSQCVSKSAGGAEKHLYFKICFDFVKIFSECSNNLTATQFLTNVFKYVSKKCRKDAVYAATWDGQTPKHEGVDACMNKLHVPQVERRPSMRNKLQSPL